MILQRIVSNCSSKEIVQSVEEFLKKSVAVLLTVVRTVIEMAYIDYYKYERYYCKTTTTTTTYSPVSITTAAFTATSKPPQLNHIFRNTYFSLMQYLASAGAPRAGDC